MLLAKEVADWGKYKKKKDYKDNRTLRLRKEPEEVTKINEGWQFIRAYRTRKGGAKGRLDERENVRWIGIQQHCIFPIGLKQGCPLSHIRLQLLPPNHSTHQGMSKP